MLLLLRRAVDDVVPFVELRQQSRDLLGWLLKIVVQRDDHLVPAASDATEQRVVLPVVSHKVDADDLGIPERERLDRGPAVIATAVVHQDDFVRRGELIEHDAKPVDQRRQSRRAVVDRYHDRDRRAHGPNGSTGIRGY